MPVPTTYVHNSGHLDLDFLRIMGASAKVKANPIGRFGTGMKYAISVLLRTGHGVVLRTGGRRYVFSAKKKVIRGQTFDVVCMNFEELPFTLDYGRDWEVWQAYRELHSNAMDEGGGTQIVGVDDDTVFEITGHEYRTWFDNRRVIFTDAKVLETVGGVEIRAGESEYVYYRGVRAGKLPKKARYTYNFVREMSLTEDRVFSSQWDVEYYLSLALVQTQSETIATTLCTEDEGFDRFETGICIGQYGGAETVSKTFKNAVVTQRSNTSAPEFVRRLASAIVASDGEYDEVMPTEQEAAVLARTYDLLRKLDCDLDPAEVILVESLGPSVWGAYHRPKDQIFLARASLDQGERHAAATLYEEWCHKRHKLRDETRQFQNFLLAKLIARVSD